MIASYLELVAFKEYNDSCLNEMIEELFMPIFHYVYDVLVVSLIGDLYDHHISQKAATAKQEAVR